MFCSVSFYNLFSSNWNEFLLSKVPLFSPSGLGSIKVEITYEFGYAVIFLWLIFPLNAYKFCLISILAALICYTIFALSFQGARELAIRKLLSMLKLFVESLDGAYVFSFYTRPISCWMSAKPRYYFYISTSFAECMESYLLLMWSN